MLKVFLRKVPFPLNSKNNRFFSLARVCVYASLESMRLLLFVLTKSQNSTGVQCDTKHRGRGAGETGSRGEEEFVKENTFFQI